MIKVILFCHIKNYQHLLDFDQVHFVIVCSHSMRKVPQLARQYFVLHLSMIWVLLQTLKTCQLYLYHLNVILHKDWHVASSAPHTQLNVTGCFIF